MCGRPFWRPGNDMDSILSLIERIDGTHLKEHLFYLAKDPLPCRTLNCTLPGHEMPTLYEADDYIARRLGSWGYPVEREPVAVQAYRCDETKDIHHQYSPPDSSDPWYTAHNLYAKKIGKKHPDEIIIVISHKDSQSWNTAVPGAHDNAVGTVGTMEIAQVLADYPSLRSLWFVFCNEEHTPWTSEVTARNLAASDKRVVAVFNLDSIDGKSDEQVRSGAKFGVTRYVTPEGERLADLMADLNERHGIGLVQNKVRGPFPNDDDGSFVKAGIPPAVLVVGSFPYADPHYHLATDIPENVDIVNARMAVQLALATVLHVDGNGSPR